MGKIIQKLSLEVVAVPQEEVIHLPVATTLANTAPMKVKLRIKGGKNTNGFQQRVISVPKIEQEEKIRVIHSDQTIMSFNMLMKPYNISKPHRKSQNKFFHLFKTGKCLGTQDEGDDDSPYLLSTPNKSNEVYSVIQESQDEKQSTRLLQNKSNNKSLKEYPKQPVIFLGKCKRGGCLDPPFGEDKYQYEPSIRSKQVPKLNYKYNTENLKQTNYEKSKEITVKISNYEEIDTSSTFMLYKAKSEKSLLDGTHSDSIITYPPDMSTKDSGILEKSITARKASTGKNRLSSNITDAYFMPPKIDRSPERKVNKNNFYINTEIDRSISIPEAKSNESLLSGNNFTHLIKPTENIPLEATEIKKSVSNVNIETDVLYETDSKASINRILHPQNEDFQLNQLINQNIIDVSQNVEDNNDLDDDDRSKSVKVILEMNEKASTKISKNSGLHEIDTDTKAKCFHAIRNVENERLKQNSSNSQEYIDSYLLYNDLDNIAATEGTKIEQSIIKTSPTIKNTPSENLNLSYELSISDYNQVIKSSSRVYLTNASSNNTNLSSVTTEKETDKHEENVIQELFSLDHTYAMQSQANISQIESDKMQYANHSAQSVDQKSLSIQNDKKDNLYDFFDEIRDEVICNIQKNERINSSSLHRIKKTNDKYKDDSPVTSNVWKSNMTQIGGNYISKQVIEKNNVHKSFEKGYSVNLQEIALDEQNKLYWSHIENNNNISSKEDMEINQTIEREKYLKNEIVYENKYPEKIFPYFTEVQSRYSSTVKHSILSTSEIKSVSIDRELYANESKSDIQNSGKNATNEDDKKSIISELTDNISEEENISTDNKNLNHLKYSMPPGNNISNTLIKYIESKKSSSDPYDKSPQDFIPYVRKDMKKLSFEDNKTFITKASEQTDLNNTIMVNLAFQTYVNDNNETILRTFDVSREPQRFPNDSISVIKSKWNDNKLSFAIKSENKLSIEINRSNTCTNVDVRSLDIKDYRINGISKEIKQPIDSDNIETLQQSLEAIYENDLVPVAKLIKDLIVEIDKVTQSRMLLKNKLIATKRLKPTYANKRCGCLRK